MSLEEASRAALEAAEKGDLEALQTALDARAQAIVRGERPTKAILAMGRRTAELLGFLKRQKNLEFSRVRQLSEGLTRRRPPSFDLRA